jgi:hypothetical protein
MRMSESSWPWFEFPLGPNGREDLVALFELHEGRAFLKFSTPVPGHPAVVLLQVLTFLDRTTGEQQRFTAGTRARFGELAGEFMAGLSDGERQSVHAVVRERRIVAAVLSGGEEELFMLAPVSAAELLHSRIDEILADPSATFNRYRCGDGGQSSSTSKRDD